MRSEVVIQEMARSSLKYRFSDWSSDNIVFHIDSGYSDSTSMSLSCLGALRRDKYRRKKDKGAFPFVQRKKYTKHEILAFFLLTSSWIWSILPQFLKKIVGSWLGGKSYKNSRNKNREITHKDLDEQSAFPSADWLVGHTSHVWRAKGPFPLIHLIRLSCLWLELQCLFRSKKNRPWDIMELL